MELLVTIQELLLVVVAELLEITFLALRVATPATLVVVGALAGLGS